jgi:hypothetical protein
VKRRVERRRCDTKICIATVSAFCKNHAVPFGGVRMSTGASALQNDPKIEFYKMRAVEFRARYESMRSLEWKMLIQAYGGYSAIAIGFSKIIRPNWLSVFAIVATFLFFLATQYISFRIQERLIKFNEIYEYLVEKVESSLQVDMKVDPTQEKYGHEYFWTYDTQLFLGFLTAVGLLWYETTLVVKEPRVCLCILASLVALAGIYALSLRVTVRNTYHQTISLYRKK